MDYLDLSNALCSKGKARPEQRDHLFFFVEEDGKEFRATKISHGASGQIDDDTRSLIAHQMRLTTKELKEFVACPMGRDEWLKLRCDRGRGWRMGI